MSTQLLAELRSFLAQSDSQLRKKWARQIAEQKVPLESLLSLLHGETKTAQRFTWLISDIGEAAPDLLAPCMPMLFSLRDQMPFPGMQRGVAKWLLITNVPANVEEDATEQLLAWMRDPNACIASKSFSARVLTELALQGRISTAVVKRVFQSQVGTINRAYSRRMEKLVSLIDQRSMH